MSLHRTISFRFSKMNSAISYNNFYWPVQYNFIYYLYKCNHCRVHECRKSRNQRIAIKRTRKKWFVCENEGKIDLIFWQEQCVMSTCFSSFADHSPDYAIIPPVLLFLFLHFEHRIFCSHRDSVTRYTYYTIPITNKIDLTAVNWYVTNTPDECVSMIVSNVENAPDQLSMTSLTI